MAKYKVLHGSVQKKDKLYVAGEVIELTSKEAKGKVEAGVIAPCSPTERKPRQSSEPDKPLEDDADETGDGASGDVATPGSETDAAL